MSARIAPEPTSVGSQFADYRQRLPSAPQLAAAPELPTQSPQPAQRSERPQQQQQQAPQAEPEPQLPPGAMFAAAVVAGSLPPVPQTPEELVMRIGQAWATSGGEITDRSA